ncbi:choline transporter-like 2 [Lycorma delicatula]|uniref:choline transporter-like 2 n=1 Tax=Lycorma delicatula TaxID=130591 RepID=UPI003F513E9C
MAPRNQRHDYGTQLQHEPEFTGPRGRRSCTDIICLLLFIVALVVWILVGRYAYLNGDPNKLIVPADSEGRRCGQDSGVSGKPYLLFFDLTQCATPNVLFDGCATTQLCVEKCPDTEWTAYVYINEMKPFDASEVQNKLICKTRDIALTVTDVEKLKVVINNGQCAPWYLPSNEVYGRCLPSLDEIKKEQSLLDISQTSVDQIMFSTDAVQKLSTINEVFERVVEDLMNTWQYIVIGLVIAVIVSLLYITMLRWLAGLMIWISLLAITILLGFAVYICFIKYQYYSAHEKTDQPFPGKRTLRTMIKDFFSKKSTWAVLSIFSAVLFIIAVLVLIFLRQRISIAITLIKEGSKAVSSVLSALFFPVFPWVFQMAVVFYFIVVAVNLASIGHNVFKVYGVNNNSHCVCTNGYKNGEECTVEEFNANCYDPTAKGLMYAKGSCVRAGCNFFTLQSDNIIVYLQMYNLFVMFWSVWFLSGMAQMILAATFATWYWTFHKRNLPFFTLTASMYRTIRFHLGTIAFGSLIIAICSFIRTIIEFIELKLKKYDNAVTKAIFCLLKCCFWCLHKFICFINTNAYIMCAVHGKNFCTSAQEAFFLLMRNVVRVIVVDKVTDFLFFLGRVVITAVIMVGAYFVFKDEVRVLDNSGNDVHLNYYYVPIVALGIGTYLIASVFFGVYAMAVDTLFLCFLEDCERNDGSPDKPYFMSKKLMKILGKKNKKP